MSTSQNGWPVFFTAPSGQLPGFVTGRVRDDHVETVFMYLCKRWHAEVEEIKQSWSWGWAVRAVRGQTSGYSNHASATAIDINAPAHPLGVSGTYTGFEEDCANQILEDLEGVLRWGENYSGRKDGMHVEVDDDYDAIRRMALRIKHGDMPDLVPEWKPKQAKAVHFGRVQEQFLIAAGHESGKLVQLNGVGLIQEALDKVLKDRTLEADGYVGRATLEAWKKWEDSIGPYRGHGRPRIPDSHSAELLGERAGLNFVGKWDD